MRLKHYMREVDGRVARYHLRVDDDGAGLLLANASAAVKLSPTGVAIARGILDGDHERDVVARIARSFRGVSRSEIGDDVARVRATLDELVTRRERYPLRDIDDPTASVFRRTLSAPLSADIEPGDGASVDAILRRLWEAGVPQVVFCVRDAGARDRAARWVERAEDLGMIAGVRGRASVLGSLRDLAEAGVDHVDVLVAGADAAAHDRFGGDGDFAALEALFDDARACEVCPVAWLPVVRDTLPSLEAIAARIDARSIGAAIAVAVCARAPAADDAALPARALPQAAARVEELAERYGLAAMWAPPVERDPLRTLVEQVREGPRSAGEASVRIAADGAVLPPTGPSAPAGNVLADPWPEIWGRPAFRHFREAADDPPRCTTCPNLTACAVGCPREPVTWARLPEGA